MLLERRQFLAALGAGLAIDPRQAWGNGAAAAEKNGDRHDRVAVPNSHAWHMGERFLVGYPIDGRWHQPPFDVVAAYVDQKPDNDLSRKRAEEFGFPIYPTIAEALRCGGKELAVDAVLIIGEHGNYPKNEFGQTKYPRYEFFKQVDRRLPQGRPGASPSSTTSTCRGSGNGPRRWSTSRAS